MLPVNSSEDIDKYETEPYVYSEYVTSPDHETENQASHSWLTGSAVWMYRIGLDYILGLQTSLNGIRINPSIPAIWDGFKIERTFRGKILKVDVKNPNKVNSGVKEIVINGITIEGNFIDITSYDVKELNISVTLG